MYKFSKEELTALLSKVYEAGYYGFLDLIDSEVERRIEECQKYLCGVDQANSQSQSVTFAVGSENIGNDALIPSLAHSTILSWHDYKTKIIGENR